MARAHQRTVDLVAHASVGAVVVLLRALDGCVRHRIVREVVVGRGAVVHLRPRRIATHRSETWYSNMGLGRVRCRGCTNARTTTPTVSTPLVR